MDICKCYGKDCPLKDKCYRYTAPFNDYYQTYFIEPPYEGDTCEYLYTREDNG